MYSDIEKRKNLYLSLSQYYRETLNNLSGSMGLPTDGFTIDEARLVGNMLVSDIYKLEKRLNHCEKMIEIISKQR